MKPEETELMLSKVMVRVYDKRRDDAEFKDAVRRLVSCFGELSCDFSCGCGLKLLCLGEKVKRMVDATKEVSLL